MGEKTEREKKVGLAILCVCIGQVLWGFSFMFTRMALNYAGPNTLLSVRFTIAFFILMGMLATSKCEFSPRKKRWKRLVALAIMEPVYFLLETYGILYTNATFAGVILSIVPVIAMGMAAVTLGEYPAKKQVVFCVVSVFGMILITVSGSSMGVWKPIGIVLLLLTAVSCAVYRTANRYLALEFSPFERTFCVLLVSMVFFTVMALQTAGWDVAACYGPVFEPGFLVPVLMLSVFCSVISNMLVNYGAGKISVTKLSTLANIQTVCSIFGGIVFLQEPMTTMTFVGSILIFVGIWNVTKVKSE